MPPAPNGTKERTPKTNLRGSQSGVYATLSTTLRTEGTNLYCLRWLEFSILNRQIRNSNNPESLIPKHISRAIMVYSVANSILPKSSRHEQFPSQQSSCAPCRFIIRKRKLNLVFLNGLWLRLSTSFSNSARTVQNWRFYSRNLYASNLKRNWRNN